jgi:hypothetical protein
MVPTEERVRQAIESGWLQPDDYFDRAHFDADTAVATVMALLAPAQLVCSRCGGTGEEPHLQQPISDPDMPHGPFSKSA